MQNAADKDGIMCVATILYQPQALNTRPESRAHIFEYSARCKEWLDQCIRQSEAYQVDLTAVAECLLRRSTTLPDRFARLRAALVVRYNEYASALDGGIVRLEWYASVEQNDKIDYLEGYVLPPTGPWVL